MIKNTQSNLQKIVVTGGHLAPALATIEQLKKLAPSAQIYFFGRKKTVEGDNAISFEFLEISNQKIPFFEIPAGRLQRRLTKHFLISLLRILPGFIKSLVLLLRIRPDVVLTFGGYVALPVAVASKFCQIPIIAHEQSPSLGLANKIIFKLAKLKAVSEKSLVEKGGGQNVFFTGPLLRSAIFEKKAKSQSLAKFLEKTADEKLIYVTGGATGSYFLNQIVKVIISDLLKKSFVIVQTGNLSQSAEFKKLLALKANLPENLSEKFFLTEFVSSSDIGAIFARADLIITRSGANTTSELLVLGKVAVVIPLEWGAEQKEISKNLQKTTVFVVIDQSQAKAEKILETVEYIFENFGQFQEKANKLKTKISKTGAKFFAKEILNLKLK